MSKTPEPAGHLSDADRTVSDAARTAARERFKHLADDRDEAPGEPAPGDPSMTDEQFARLRPAAEMVPGLVVAGLRRKGGRPKSDAPKVAVSIRLDADVVEALRSSGEGWQSRNNEMLRRVLGPAA